LNILTPRTIAVYLGKIESIISSFSDEHSPDPLTNKSCLEVQAASIIENLALKAGLPIASGNLNLFPVQTVAVTFDSKGIKYKLPL
jgi:hypothetical protein